LISGGVAAFAHFSAMPGSKGDGLAEEDRGVVAEVGRTYDSNEHLSNKAQHTSALDAGFVDRFAIVGSPDDCVAKAAGLVGLGLSQLVLIGATFQADRDAARMSAQLITNEFIPGLRAAVASR
jgi:5,10-methylenetetrahydromethanopterin reductase